MRTIDQLLQTVQQEISGARALDTASAVARYNRIVGSSDYAAAVHLLRKRLEAYCLDEVTVESFPIDGHTTYAERVFAPAWEPHSARLQVVAPESYLIADFATTPMCLPSGCPPTPPEGVTAELVDVGAGDRPEEYAGLDVAGKAVLATGLTTDVYDLAVEQYGAVCVLTNNMYSWSELPEIQRTMVDLPDATHLARLYHDEEKARTQPAFSISYRQAQRLRALLKAGAVVVQADVDTQSGAGELLEVVATIAGSDMAAQEVWVTAHLCHPKPGACDNGSGVALGVELFRTIAALIRSGELPRPRRTLRLLLLPEMSGTFAYADRYQDRLAQVAALINLDMVGANHAATGSYCRLVQSPWSRPTFLNHLGAYLLETVSQGSHSHIRREPVRNWLYAVAPYDKGSDHDVTLNCQHGIPSLFFFYWPHRFYHTDHDTPEKLDALEFERTGTVAAVMVLLAASMTVESAQALLQLICVEATRTISSLLQGIGYGQEPANAQQIWALGEMEQAALGSVLTALPEAERESLGDTVQRMQNELHILTKPYNPENDAAHGAGVSRSPKRLSLWPLSLGKIEKQMQDAQPLKTLRVGVDFDDKAIQAFNYADGSRSLQQIADLVSGELGLFPMEDVTAYFDILAQAGLVAM